MKDDADIELRAKVSFPSPDNAPVLEAARTLLEQGGYEAVAEVEGDDPELAWALTQNGLRTPSWTLQPPEGLTPLLGPVIHEGKSYGRRSSMVGDIVRVDGADWIAVTVGFEKLRTTN